MGYSSTGPKPIERASKASHHHVINDEVVQAAVANLYVPPAQKVEELIKIAHEYEPVPSRISRIVAIDCGYTEVPVKANFPSAKLHFFQFGALVLKLEDLRQVAASRHPDPDDMSRLKKIERLKLALPTRNVRSKHHTTLKDSVRRALYDFFCHERLQESKCLMETLAWFLFRQYKGRERDDSDKSYYLSSNPHEKEKGGFDLREDSMAADFTFTDASGRTIFLTDVFRSHERIDEEGGAGGICGYVAGAVEHMIALHIIRHLLDKYPSGFPEVLFVMDRPTGFFGLTSRLHQPMMGLVAWMMKEGHPLYWVGLEKSGAFVEYAATISSVMKPGTFLILDADYIYKHISAGDTDSDVERVYARSSYYGEKIIFKTRAGNMYVVSVPVPWRRPSPSRADLPNLDVILTHVEDLKCDMYQNALFPIALANKLVSLSAFPSTQILTQFARSTVRERP